MDALNQIKNSTKEELILEIKKIKANYESLKESFGKLKEKNSKTQNELTSLKKELKDNEVKFRLLFDNMDEGFALHQLVKNEKGEPVDYKIVDVNISYERILGISAEKARGALASKLYGTNTAPYLKEYAEVVKNKKPYIFETYFIDLDKHFHISVNTPYPEYFITIFSDISGRIKNDEQIRKNEIMFKAITENAMEGISLADMNGNYVFVNSAFAKMVGYTKEELLKMSLFDIKPQGEKNSTLFHVLKQNSEKRIGKSSRNSLLCKDNSIIYVNINAKLIDIGKEKFALGIVRDESVIVKWENELIESKEKAEESENRFRTIAEYSVDGITIADPEGNYVYVNNKFCEMSGYSREELLSMTAFDMAAEKLPKEMALSQFQSDDNFSGKVQYFTLRRKDGTKYHTEITGTNIEINRENLVLGFIKDISEIVKYEDELIRAKEKAEESDRLKSAFLMNVSHEIRTPMNGILGFVNFLDEPDLDEKDRKSFIDIVNKSGERLLNTINDIVEISKIEAGDINIVNEETNVSELMQFQFNFFKIQAKEKGIKFRIKEQIEGTQSIIITDKQKLDGILMNLIRNAVKFTPNGKIEIGNYIENERLYFYVSDSGRGIPEDKVETIFDRFVQVELGNTRSYEGSGIGLSIVKAYITALDGDIKVKSEIDKGSTFLFSIPYKPVMNNTKDKRIDKSDENLSLKYTLLIAEDDDVNYYFLETILSKEYNLIHAVNGEEAVRLFTENPEISLVLMDIKMPGEYDGLVATQKIKEIKKQVPIIAQTAYAMEADKTAALEAGCSEYITKPFNVDNIISLIRKYCKPKNQKTE